MQNSIHGRPEGHTSRLWHPSEAENIRHPHPVPRLDRLEVAEWRFMEVKPQNKHSLSQNSLLLGVQPHKPQTHTSAWWFFSPSPASITFGSPFLLELWTKSLFRSKLSFIILYKFCGGNRRQVNVTQLLHFARAADMMWLCAWPYQELRVLWANPGMAAAPSINKNPITSLLCKPNVHPLREEPGDASN